MEEPTHPDAPVPLPITGELDLHTFRPSEVAGLLSEYFDECLARGIREVRVIHGRGTGQLRAGVWAVLRRLPQVERFALASPAYGGPGATWIRLRG